MEPSRVRVTFSQKGKQKLCMEGYVYDRNKISKDGRRIYWECERRRDIQCNVQQHQKPSWSAAREESIIMAAMLDVRHKLTN